MPLTLFRLGHHLYCLFQSHFKRSILNIVVAVVVLLALTPSAHAQSSPTHTIQPGETLSQIAEMYNIPLAELMELNSVSDPDAIVSGQILVLPVASNATPVPVAVDESYGTPDKTPVEHVVLPGESLSAIAMHNGLTLEELMAYNGISDANSIVIGTKLRLTPVIDTKEAQASAPTPEAHNSGNPIASLNRTYAAQAGDSVTSIALRFGVDEDTLRWLNKLDGESALELGQTLILPATAQEMNVAGKSLGASAVEAAEPKADVDDRPRYVVKAADSSGRIAQEKGLSLAEIMEADQIADPDSIYVGQELIIPEGAASSSAEGNRQSDTGGRTESNEESDKENDEASATPTPPQPIGRPRSGFFYYTVKAGDNLTELAREFDSTQLALLEYNDLPDAETVYAGLELRIPFGPPPLPLTMPPIPFSGSHFVVSLSRQQCWVLEGNSVRYSWSCSTGYGKWITRTGNFAIQSKIEMAKSTAYELDMPYWLGIYDVGTFENGIHGLPLRWDTGEKIWEGFIGQPATFGCAMLADKDAETLYELAFLGMPVHIVP